MNLNHFMVEILPALTLLILFRLMSRVRQVTVTAGFK